MTDEDIEFSDCPNDRYKKFFDKFSEIETLDVKEWKPAHLLGYFCKKYKQTYKANYAWKFNNPAPSKCFEVWQMSVLSSKLSSNPKILRDYIDWAYENIVPKAKRRLTSISFMTKEEVINDYKLNVLFAGMKGSNVDRSTILPANYQDAIREASGISIKTYGDLSFLSQMSPPDESAAKALAKIIEMGFDMEILKRIV